MQFKCFLTGESAFVSLFGYQSAETFESLQEVSKEEGLDWLELTTSKLESWENRHAARLHSMLRRPFEQGSSFWYLY